MCAQASQQLVALVIDRRDDKTYIECMRASVGATDARDVDALRRVQERCDCVFDELLDAAFATRARLELALPADKVRAKVRDVQHVAEARRA